MPIVVLQVLNILLIVVHTALVLFNVLGWMHARTRRANLVCLLLTLASWTVMGIWHGIGYCVLTDWHWQVRSALGLPNRADNYVSFLLETLTPLRLGTDIVRNASASIFLFSLVMSIGLNYRDRHPGLDLRSLAGR